MTLYANNDGLLKEVSEKTFKFEREIQVIFEKNLPEYKLLYEFLKSIGLEFEKEDESLNNLKGFKFALTGDGPMKRSEIQKQIESRGGEVVSAGKSTDYLVTNDTYSNSGKMKAAEKLGIPVISYDTLFQDYLN